MCLIRGTKDYADVYFKMKKPGLFSNLTFGHLETSNVKKTTFIYKRVRVGFRINFWQVLYQSPSHLLPLQVTLATIFWQTDLNVLLSPFWVGVGGTTTKNPASPQQIVSKNSNLSLIRCRSSSAPALHDHATLLEEVGKRVGVHIPARYPFLILKYASILNVYSTFTGSLDNMNYAFFNVFIPSY